MSAPTSLETGRTNVIASFNKWIKDVIAPMSPLPGPVGLETANIPFSVQFERAVQIANLASGPILCVSDTGLSAPARVDVNDRARFDDSSQTEYQATRQETLIEFVIWGSQAVRPDEDVRIRMIRDAVIGAYRLAGRRLANGQFDVEPLRIWKFTSALDPAGVVATANFIEKDRLASWLSEDPDMRDPDHPELRGWRGLLKVYWLEFFNAP